MSLACGGHRSTVIILKCIEFLKSEVKQLVMIN